MGVYLCPQIYWLQCKLTILCDILVNQLGLGTILESYALWLQYQVSGLQWSLIWHWLALIWSSTDREWKFPWPNSLSCCSLLHKKLAILFFKLHAVWNKLSTQDCQELIIEVENFSASSLNLWQEVHNPSYFWHDWRRWCMLALIPVMSVMMNVFNVIWFLCCVLSANDWNLQVLDCFGTLLHSC